MKGVGSDQRLGIPFTEGGIKERGRFSCFFLMLKRNNMIRGYKTMNCVQYKITIC